MRMLRLREMETTHTTGSIVLLTRLARLVYRRSTEDLLGIRLKQLAALAYLRDHEAASQQALMQAFCLDANSCVLLLNELEAAGFAERRRDASGPPPAPGGAHARGQAGAGARRARAGEHRGRRARGARRRTNARRCASCSAARWKRRRSALADDEHVAVRVGDDAERGRAQ